MYLKKVTYKDCELLFQWVNDNEVRKNSFNVEKIQYEDHVKWFKNKMDSHNQYMFILYDEEGPKGQIRVDIEENKGGIGYSIDSKYRGKGYGSKILELIEREILIRNIQIHKLIGEVKYSNIASQKAFEKNGYVKLEKEDHIKYIKELL